MATAPGDAWQRQMVRTVNAGYSWHTATGASNTTTYAITVADIPGGANSGFEAMMYLIPENGMSSPDGGSVDWDSANVAYFTINANGNGTAKGNFRYKTNSAGAENFQSWTDHNCPTGPLGTWQLSFNNDTNVTITSPDATSTSFIIPEDAAANFQGGLIAYFGSRPGSATRIGLSATYSRIKITGAAATIDDTFVSSPFGSPHLGEEGLESPRYFHYRTRREILVDLASAGQRLHQCFRHGQSQQESGERPMAQPASECHGLAERGG